MHAQTRKGSQLVYNGILAEIERAMASAACLDIDMVDTRRKGGLAPKAPGTYMSLGHCVGRAAERAAISCDYDGGKRRALTAMTM